MELLFKEDFLEIASLFLFCEKINVIYVNFSITFSHFCDIVFVGVICMFKNTSQKIKICAYIFFFGNVLRQVYREIWRFIQLGSPLEFIVDTILNVCTTVLVFFIISLFIYGFGNIVAYYEEKNASLK